MPNRFYAVRRLRPLIVLAAFAVGFARAGDAPKAQSAADMLPEGTIMYAEIAPWGAWSKDFSQTSVSKIFAEPEVRTFLAGPFSQISFLIKRATEGAPPVAPVPPPPDKVNPPPKPAEPGNIFSILDSVAPGPIVMAVRYSAEDAQAKRPPAAAIIIRVADEKRLNEIQGIVQVVERLLKGFSIEAVSIDEYQNFRILSIRASQGAGKDTIFGAALVNGRLLIANEQRFCTQIIDGMMGNLPKKLSDNETYKNTGLTGSEHLIAYLDVASLEKALGAAPRNPEAPNQLDDFFVLTGLNKTIAVAWSLKMSGPAFESRTAIFSKEEREGILGTLDEAPLSADAFKICPANTPFAAGFRLKPTKVMPFVRNVIRAIQGQKGLADFNAVEKQINEEFGKDLEKEMTAAFGNELMVTSLAGPAGGPVGEVAAFAASLSVTDLKRAEELLAQVLTRVAAKTDRGGNAANVLREVEYDGAKVRYLSPPNVYGIVSPSFVFQDNRLVMALDVPTLKRAMKVLKDGGGLANARAFKDSLEAVGGQTGPMFSYVDWAFVYRTVFTFGATTLKLVAPTDILREIGIDMNLLPTPETVTQHLFPGLSVAKVTPNGVVLISRSPLPSIEVLSPPAAAIGSVFASFRPFIAPAAEKKE